MSVFAFAFWFLLMPLGYFVNCLQFREKQFEREIQFDNLLPTQSFPYIQTTETFSLQRCLALCNGLDACVSVVYSKGFRECKLLNCYLNVVEVSSPPSIEWVYVVKVTGCPSGWRRYQDHCYLFEQTFLIWSEAKTNCTNNGAYLVEIDSKEEDDWLVEQILMSNGGENENQFLGANSEVQLGVWRWSTDNALISYSNFWPGQPNLYAAERCIILDWIAIHGTYKWADTRCLTARKFICEKDL